MVQAIDFARAQALTGLARAREALHILEGLDAQALTQASPAKDWDWRLQAERGRALMAAGQRAEGAALVRQALEPMAKNGSAGWVLASYKAMLQ